MTERILNERYALETKVGEGGMAVTYRARDLLLNRTVAVKVMREQFTTDPQFIERFRREAQAAARLNHEHIAGVYDTGRADGAYYIVMEFVEGTDLKHRLRREGALPMLTALEIARQTAAALEAAHRAGLVHRDVKPHNILLNQDGKVKVADFGIAKQASESDDTGVIIGSVHYLSPEQARGEATTAASDLYALGAVLYETLTGHTVFTGENAMAVAHKQIYEKPTPPSALQPGIIPAVDALVLRCLDKDPATRYQSAGEVKAALTQLITQLSQEETIVIPTPAMDATTIISRPAPVPTPPPTPASAPSPCPIYLESGPPPRNGAGGWVIFTLAVVLVALGGFGYLKYFKPGATPRPPQVVPNTGPKVQVPELLGLTADQAADLLKRRNIVGQPDHEFNADVDEGVVGRQDPAPGDNISRNIPVIYWVSDGPRAFTVPDVSRMSDAAAKRELRTAGFTGTFATPKKEESDVPKGFVIRTEPISGTLLDRKGKLTLVLSSGATPPIAETYDPGSAPDLGSPTVFVRIEIERTKGDTEVLWQGTVEPGKPIEPQTFDRKSSEKVTVRTLIAPSEDQPLDVHEEQRFPPQGADDMPTAPPSGGTATTQ